MNRRCLILTSLGFCMLAGALPTAQAPGLTKPLDIVAAAGCLERDGRGWVLTHATEPLWAPGPGGAERTSVAVTVEMAGRQPAGKERYRLMGVLEEFGVPDHEGHKMLIKGLLVVDAGRNEKRINVTSAQMAASNCR